MWQIFEKLKTRHTLNASLFNPVQLKPKDGFLLKLEEVLSDLDSQPNSVSACLVTMMTSSSKRVTQNTWVRVWEYICFSYIHKLLKVFCCRCCEATPPACSRQRPKLWMTSRHHECFLRKSLDSLVVWGKGVSLLQGTIYIVRLWKRKNEGIFAWFWSKIIPVVLGQCGQKTRRDVTDALRDGGSIFCLVWQ